MIFRNRDTRTAQNDLKMKLLTSASRVLREEGAVSLFKKSSDLVHRKARHGFEREYYDRRYSSQYIFDDDWDTMILLDACRYDVWEEVMRDLQFLNSAEHDFVYTPASSSREWMEANFAERFVDMMNKTAYVTANPFTKDHVKEDNFALVDEIWRYGWDHELGVVPPDVVTDRAIDVARSKEPERLLVHYMQPHFPSLRRPELGSKIDPETNSWINSVWDKIENGEISQETAWQAYRHNLEDVLDSVDVLLRNHSASDVVITSDHGNGFGERGIYGHPGNRAHRVLREVPYVQTDAVDEETYSPEHSHQQTNVSEDDVQDRLASLGYLDE